VRTGGCCTSGLVERRSSAPFSTTTRSSPRHYSTCTKRRPTAVTSSARAS
jgi:hypothetical protein